MAKKLFLFCATLALCVFLTNASIYRAVVEFDEDDVTDRYGRGGGGQQQRCRREFQQEQHLRGCQQWIQQRVRQGGGGGYGPYDELDLDFDFDFENRHGSMQRPPLLQQCCQELRQEDPVCVCPTLRQAAQAVRYQQQQGQGQGQQHRVRQIYRTARKLPQVCGIQQVGVCPFRASPFSPY